MVCPPCSCGLWVERERGGGGEVISHANCGQQVPHSHLYQCSSHDHDMTASGVERQRPGHGLVMDTSWTREVSEPNAVCFARKGTAADVNPYVCQILRTRNARLAVISIARVPPSARGGLIVSLLPLDLHLSENRGVSHEATITAYARSTDLMESVVMLRTCASDQVGTLLQVQERVKKRGGGARYSFRFAYHGYRWV